MVVCGQYVSRANQQQRVVSLHVDALVHVAPAKDIPAVEPSTSFALRSTAYNPVSWQTDSTPRFTATGREAVPGVIALSQDMLRIIPYGSFVRVTEVSGSPRSCNGTLEMLSKVSPYGEPIFQVADTMHRRKTRQADVLMADRNRALTWGVCRITFTLIPAPALLASLER